MTPLALALIVASIQEKTCLYYHFHVDFRKAQLWAQPLGSKLASELISSPFYANLCKFYIKVTYLG